MLPGQETLLASWGALARLSPGARLVRLDGVVAAVFPHWAPLNNAIALADPGTAAGPLDAVYGAAGVTEWALWLPSPAADLDAPDGPGGIEGYARDMTTLVMRTGIPDGLRQRSEVVPASIAGATLATDEPVPLADLGPPETGPGLRGWALVRDGLAVAGAWTHRHGEDCGIYAFGTVPAWQRRGLGRALLEHVLAVARQDGARTATLQSTRMGQPLYAAAGFAPAGRYEEWVRRVPG